MKDTLTFNETVREALGLALFQLMKRKPFQEITISELVKVAGVSRSSFYRNFTSKEQMLCGYISTLYQNFFQTEAVPRQMNRQEDVRAFLLPRFQFIKQHRALFAALCEHNMLYYFFQQTESNLIVLLCGQKESLSPYYRAMCSGACAGIVRCWIENGFRETEEEMVALFVTPPGEY